jgi:hypothetical protein
VQREGRVELRYEALVSGMPSACLCGRKSGTCGADIRLAQLRRAYEGRPANDVGPVLRRGKWQWWCMK